MEYSNFLKALFPAFRELLENRLKPRLVDDEQNRFRSLILEILHRLPNNDVLKPYVHDVTVLARTALKEDNEDNAHTCLKIIFDLHKNYRELLKSNAQPVLDIVATVYEQLPQNVQRLFAPSTQPGANQNGTDAGNGNGPGAGAVSGIHSEQHQASLAPDGPRAEAPSASQCAPDAGDEVQGVRGLSGEDSELPHLPATELLSAAAGVPLGHCDECDHAVSELPRGCGGHEAGAAHCHAAHPCDRVPRGLQDRLWRSPPCPRGKPATAGVFHVGGLRPLRTGRADPAAAREGRAHLRPQHSRLQLAPEYSSDFCAAAAQRDRLHLPQAHGRSAEGQGPATADPEDAHHEGRHPGDLHPLAVRGRNRAEDGKKDQRGGPGAAAEGDARPPSRKHEAGSSAAGRRERCPPARSTSADGAQEDPMASPDTRGARRAEGSSQSPEDYHPGPQDRVLVHPELRQGQQPGRRGQVGPEVLVLSGGEGTRSALLPQRTENLPDVL
eukprot:scaffold870_cov268-Pinguiococcus_pyrenoidosus.AAC.7